MRFEESLPLKQYDTLWLLVVFFLLQRDQKQQVAQSADMSRISAAEKNTPRTLPISRPMVMPIQKACSFGSRIATPSPKTVPVTIAAAGCAITMIALQTLRTLIAEKSTPGRIRTYNPRFRRPMRYPVAPRALASHKQSHLHSASRLISHVRIKSRPHFRNALTDTAFHLLMK